MLQADRKRIDGLVCANCADCGAPMRLFGIEPHPTVSRTDLFTYVCARCDAFQTEVVPLRP